MIVGWDPTARQRDHRRRAGGLPGERPARTRPACRRRSACSAARSTPASRASASRARRCGCRASRRAYQLGDRTVLKGGYGLYYDTLTAADYAAAQTGYSVTTTSTISDDLGRTFKWATPATGSASFDPFPVRADGTRWDPIVGDTLGVNTVLGGDLDAPRTASAQHARQQRWRRVAPAGADVQPRRRGRLHRRLQRPSAGQHPRRLPAGAVLERQRHAATPRPTRS